MRDGKSVVDLGFIERNVRSSSCCIDHRAYSSPLASLRSSLTKALLSVVNPWVFEAVDESAHLSSAHDLRRSETVPEVSLLWRRAWICS